MPLMCHRGADRRRQVALAAIAAMAAVLAGIALVPGRAGAAGVLLSQGRPVTASSSQSPEPMAPDNAPDNAVDGDPTTRWSSAFSDPQWLQVDLGAPAAIDQVVLSWEVAYARAFQIQVSPDSSAWTTIYETGASGGGIQTLPVTGTGRYVRMNGTTRATPYGYSLWEFQVFGTVEGAGAGAEQGAAVAAPPPASPQPPAAPDDGEFWGDTSSIPAAQNALTVKVLNRTNGRYPDDQVYWSFNGQTHSIAEQPHIDMPVIEAARIYFYLGSPNSQYQDFIEATVEPTVFHGNTTQVSGFGLKLAMRLHSWDGADTIVGLDPGTFAEDREATFQRYRDEVPTEFKHLADVQAPYRIIPPAEDASFKPGGANANYFPGYVASDVLGCSGPLAAAPEQCAALNRGVPVGQLDAGQFYRAGPANYYSKFWHDHSIGGRAYGFPYDDVGPHSALVSVGRPQYLLVAVGW
jgi:F5/8 type C domain/Beta-1,3-glucanase